MSTHAVLSPSSAHRWSQCTASIAASKGKPDTAGDAARIGTMCHEVASRVLSGHSIDPDEYIGRELLFVETEDGARVEDTFADEWGDIEPEGVKHRHTFTESLSELTFSYVKYVRDVHAARNSQLFIEQKVPIEHITGEDGATGSSDAIIIGDDWLTVIDAKFGRVRVDAFETVKDLFGGERVKLNDQMAMYAAGAIEKYNLYDVCKLVTMTIVQPPLNHISEHTCTITDLLKHVEGLRQAANEVWTTPVYRPSVDSCKYCKASGDCAAQDAQVYTLTTEGFTDVVTPIPKQVTTVNLGDKYAMIEFVKKWANDVATLAFNELTQGNPVVRSNGESYKLVEGKNRAAAWKDETKVQSLMAMFDVSVDVSHDLSLKNPSAMLKLGKAKRAKKGEKLVPPLLPRTLCEALEHMCERPPPNVAIALSSDARESLPSADDDFTDN